MKATTITIRGTRDAVRAAMENAALLVQAFGDNARDELRFSLVDAPGGRGVEVHASSPSLGRKAMKEGLRNYRSLLEAGEIPTGERCP